MSLEPANGPASVPDDEVIRFVANSGRAVALADVVRILASVASTLLHRSYTAVAHAGNDASVAHSTRDRSEGQLAIANRLHSIPVGQQHPVNRTYRWRSSVCGVRSLRINALQRLVADDVMAVCKILCVPPMRDPAQFSRHVCGEANTHRSMNTTHPKRWTRDCGLLNTSAQSVNLNNLTHQQSSTSTQ